MVLSPKNIGSGDVGPAGPESPDNPAATIALIGLGYVGLPLAVAFGAKRKTIGFDIDPNRIAELQAGHDRTCEVEDSLLATAAFLSFSCDEAAIATAQIYIITVPTPVDHTKRPDLTPLLQATKTVGRALKKGDLVIYESTVYPGATEEDCVPLLEQLSGLRFNQDFFCGYSPERINPGDKAHRLPDITKVTAGSTPQAADAVDQLYASIITAGTYKAPSIRVAEAAKVIENTQRDLNIALVNELAMIFNRLDIDTDSVLRAAGTKWNFLPFRPGLVGGHCIGVDPYYLTHKAEQIGYHPEVILAGRRINDGMGAYVASRMIKAMIRQDVPLRRARVLVLGLAFKENCPDLRNTRIVDVISELRDYGIHVDVHDPWVDAEAAKTAYGLDLIEITAQNAYDGIILAVAHDVFRQMGATSIRQLGSDRHVFCDLKSVFDENDSDLRL